MRSCIFVLPAVRGAILPFGAVLYYLQIILIVIHSVRLLAGFISQAWCCGIAWGCCCEYPLLMVIWSVRVTTGAVAHFFPVLVLELHLVACRVQSRDGGLENHDMED